MLSSSFFLLMLFARIGSVKFINLVFMIQFLTTHNRIQTTSSHQQDKIKKKKVKKIMKIKTEKEDGERGEGKKKEEEFSSYVKSPVR